MEEFKLIIEAIGGFLWNNYTLYAVVATGIIFTVWSGFSQYYALTHGFKVIKGDYDKDDDPGAISHFQALSTALSATVGLGNIGGVALAISLGGPGAVFWMWVVGFLGMAIKLSEVSLSMIHRNIDEADNPSGGPMWVVERNFSGKTGVVKAIGKLIAGIFCFALIINTITAGNMFQAWNVANLTQAYFGVPTLATGAILALIVGSVIIGGIKSIARVTSKLVPFMTVTYVVGALIVIFLNADKVPWALAAIFNEAFDPTAMSGGMLGIMILGFQRAAFSNEAGIGSAAIAHSTVQTQEPVSEGFVGLMEPFIDTVVICTLTALVILTTVYDPTMANEGIQGIALTSTAFSSTLSWSVIPLSFIALLFAFSTILSWSYYGLKGWTYIIGESSIAENIFKVFFCIFIAIGCTVNLSAVLDFSDALIFIVALPNILGLYVLAPVIKKELLSYQKRLQSGEIQNFRELND